MVYLTRKEHFNAAHKLHNAHWSEEKNKAVFGKCANPNFHGHNYDLYVTIKGKPDTETGYIMDAKHLGRIIKKEITDPLDHKNLNEQVPFLKGIMPTSENLAMIIFERLKPKIPAGTLHKVKLVETETIFVEYFGE